MFGGVCHLLSGDRFCGVYKDFLILRIGEENADKALTPPHVKPFDITGRPMKVWVMLGQDGFKTDQHVADFLNQAKKFVSSLPPK